MDRSQRLHLEFVKLESLSGQMSGLSVTQTNEPLLWVFLPGWLLHMACSTLLICHFKVKCGYAEMWSDKIHFEKRDFHKHHKNLITVSQSTIFQKKYPVHPGYTWICTFKKIHRKLGVWRCDQPNIPCSDLSSTLVLYLLPLNLKVCFHVCVLICICVPLSLQCMGPGFLIMCLEDLCVWPCRPFALYLSASLCHCIYI